MADRIATVMTPSKFTSRATIPVLLLKTRSQPDDGYEEWFTSPPPPPPSSSANTNTPSQSTETSTLRYSFQPRFIPVLEHHQNTTNLSKLKQHLQTGDLKEQYGGVIFTSQRAVEGWNSVVEEIERENEQKQAKDIPTPTLPPLLFANDNPPFPLYVVGPATARSLTSTTHHPTISRLNPTILGSNTGSGEKLASYILSHYNLLHSHRMFTYWEAPHLPFIPLEGPGLGPTGNRGLRLEKGDRKLRKRGLLFLVGETRRDVIPKTLMDGGLGEGAVGVEEWEVYGTRVREEFKGEFMGIVGKIEGEGEQIKKAAAVAVVVVFSPQGCESMLRSLDVLGEDGKAKPNPQDDGAGPAGDEVPRGQRPRRDGVRYVIATIGPTTRDYLVDTFAFDPDVCANFPTPGGLGGSIREFLEESRLGL